MKKNIKKKVTAIFLSTLMLTLSACGSSDTADKSVVDDETSTTSAEENSNETSSDELVTLTYWTPMNAAASKYVSSYNENTAYQEIMKELGIQIEFIHPAIGQEQEEFNLLFLGDELPDIIAYADHYIGGEFQGMRDGVFQDLTELIPEYAPDYYKILQDDQEFFRESSDNEGHLVSFNAYKPVGDPPYRRWVLNQALLDELGCEIPTTIDQFEDMFDKMLAKGITPYLLDKFGYEVQLMGMYDLYYTKNTHFYKWDDQIKFAPIEDKFLDYLTLLNSWYSKGYISKDFSSISETEANTMFDTGQIGTQLFAIVATYNRCQAQGIDVVAAPYPRLYEGQELHWNDYNIWPRTYFPGETAVISKDCENVEAALKLLNYGYTQEGADLLNWGVEGINWDWQGEERVYNDTMLNNPQFGTEEASYIYKALFAPKWAYPDVESHANLLKSEGALNSRMQWADAEGIDSTMQLPPFQLDEADQQRLAELMTPICTYVDEMVLKFITGAEPLSNFDTFRSTIMSMGIEEAINLEQNGYDTYISK